jgi:hypothetical protein
LSSLHPPLANAAVGTSKAIINAIRYFIVFLRTFGLGTTLPNEYAKKKGAPTEAEAQHVQIILLATSKGRKAIHPPASGS